MAPSAIDVTPPSSIHEGEALNGKNVKARTQPIANSGSLHSHDQIDLTPSIGTEIPNVQIKTLLSSSNADNLVKDLAVTGQ
jgi:hypothetical protein